MEDRDYKTLWLKQEEQKQANSTDWWIYIGCNPEYPNRSKIGLTSKGLRTRASSTRDPGYGLFYAFKVKHDIGEATLEQIENSIICMLERRYVRVIRRVTRRPSEIFEVTAEEMRDVVYEFLCENFTAYLNAYYDQDRDIWVIYSWQNPYYLVGKDLPPYYAQDNSNPPVAFECLMPPGCGDPDCTCW
jgi:hypothetical protein